MRGEVSQWKDDRGFGFILPEDGTEELFFHISSVKTHARRPQIGDIVLYESTRDSQNRLKAIAVVIEGVVAQSSSHSRSKVVQTEPRRKNVLDYVLIVMLLGSLVGVGFLFFRTGNIKSSIPYGIPAVVGFVLLNRRKRPKEKKFTCAGCKNVVEHDVRTIQAWNKGFLKLYCSSCHRKWLNENPAKTNRGGGCLGALAFLGIAPIAGISLSQWLA